MNEPPPRSRLQHKEQTTEPQTTSEKQQTQRQFDSVEELLRYDAAQVTPPPAIAKRLQASLQTAPPPPERSWWHRLFGK
jgi:hypothetical protein